MSNMIIIKIIYSILKTHYSFKPKRITCDFALSNIKVIKTVYRNDNILIIPFFFHLVQCWWRKANLLGLRKKNIVNKTRLLIFNLKILPFLNHEKTVEFYLKLKNEFECNEFDLFFEYLENTWIKLNKFDNVNLIMNYGLIMGISILNLIGKR